MKRIFLLAIATAFLASPGATQVANPCPNPSKDVLEFKDAIALEGVLNVNGDGAQAAYTPDNAGYIYHANGMNIIENGKSLECKKATLSRCNRLFLSAVLSDFGLGTQEFCLFAIEVVPLGEKPLSKCPDRDGFIVGNGKGSPKKGLQVKDIQGGMSDTYVSTTAMQHLVNGKRTQLDALTVPALVAPKKRSDLLGALVWLRYGDKEAFAIIGDAGPAFTEGSIALHQLLRYGELRKAPPPGVIPAKDRCKEAEMAIQQPYMSRGDNGKDNECRINGVAQGKANVRAWGNLGTKDNLVQMIVFPKLRVPMEGRLAKVELTAGYISALAKEKMDRNRIEEIRKCL